MRRRRIPRVTTPSLDFIVIGAQKAGTTALWRYLEDNPRLRMPPDKEAAFFTEPNYPDGLRSYMRALFRDAPARTRLGTVTPVYMVGVRGLPVPAIAERIQRTYPDVRLVALLRDPVDRALSAYRMMVRRKWEQRSFEEAVTELLEPAALERARSEPSDLTSYVVAGEYGRVLGEYRARFGADQLHVELTDDLEREPEAVVRRVCEFLGVPPHTPEHAGRRFHVGGTRRRTSPEAEADLKDYLRRNVWPQTRYPRQYEDQFDRWFDIWNVEPEAAPQPPADETARRLRDHFAADARLLAEVAGVTAPWAL